MLSTDNYWDSDIGIEGSDDVVRNVVRTRCLLPDLARLVSEYMDFTGSIFGTLSILPGENRLLGSAWSLVGETREARITTSEWGRFCAGFVFDPDQVIVDLKRRVLYALCVSSHDGLLMTRIDLLSGRCCRVKTPPTYLHRWKPRYGVSAVVLGDSMWIVGNKAGRYDLQRNAWDWIGSSGSIDGFTLLVGAAWTAVSPTTVLISGGEEGITGPLVKSCRLLSEEPNINGKRIMRTLTNAIPDLGRGRASHEMVLIPGADAVFVAEGHSSSPYAGAIRGWTRSTEVLSLRPLRKLKEDRTTESATNSTWHWRSSVELPAYLPGGISAQKVFGVGDSVVAHVQSDGELQEVKRLRICGDCAENGAHHPSQSCDTPEFRDWQHLLALPIQVFRLASFCIQ
jgi:hypothetical protein